MRTIGDILDVQLPSAVVDPNRQNGERAVLLPYMSSNFTQSLNIVDTHLSRFPHPLMHRTQLITWTWMNSKAKSWRWILPALWKGLSNRWETELVCLPCIFLYILSHSMGISLGVRGMVEGTCETFGTKWRYCTFYHCELAGLQLWWYRYKGETSKPRTRKRVRCRFSEW